jgi:glycosyltransferase involved in cell wall biosynthesis
MRIGVDGFNLALARGTGVATYARTLSHALRGMGHQIDVVFGMNIFAHTSEALREIIFFDSFGQDQGASQPKFLTKRWLNEQRARFAGHNAVEITMSGRVEPRGFAHRLPSYDRILNVPALFRNAARHYRTTKKFLPIRIENPPDVMHWTYPLPIRLEGAKNIYTIHDLVPLRLPYTTLDDKGFHFRLINDICRLANAVCTVSEASARDILSFCPGTKIINTYQSFKPNALALARTDADIAAELQGLFGLATDSYFLFFGSLEPKKNIGRMIEAFLATKTTRKLVIVGAMAWKADAELRFLQRNLDSGRIVHLEYLPEVMLMSLIRGARAVMFVSLTEGFGLPLLEAMSFGTPVLTSREGSLPEVAGEAAIFADAYDTASISFGMAQLDTDDALCASLRIAGPAQVALFSMQAYQARLAAMYTGVLGTQT